MRLALCGLPGAGKSTLFAALAGRKLAGDKGRDQAGTAILPVPDQRVDKLSALFNPKKTTHAQITYLDPAPALAKPEDPTTRLPPELRQCEGLIEVVRNFDAGLGAPNPQGDHQAFGDELLLNDLITVERRLERMAGERQRGRKVDQEELDLCQRAKAILEDNQPLRGEPVFMHHPKLKGFGLLTARPLIVVANNAEDDPTPPDLGTPEPPVVVRAAIEADLAQMEEDERAEFMADLGLTESTLDRLIKASYAAVNLISFFTVGPDEVRAWTVRAGAPADEAAGVIHSDLQKGFIRAEVMRYEDITSHGSEAAVKKAGLMKLCGRDYLVQDGDILHVRFNL
ncbi:MAG: redox-regulated ATPase YchF [Desulfarculus sp.]|nr:redox-regulated ATPase YchF [Desulfarculus sp.]